MMYAESRAETIKYLFGFLHPLWTFCFDKLWNMKILNSKRKIIFN